ncbi:sushi repeat-containing protein SRPX2-like [Saccostrea cucullata]|uniref:sushi repeat-containing protein SRPX2-like n=1 Tax=Saccostrea cuccullata TaxID=36930 RepID=UPI002ED38BD3
MLEFTSTMEILSYLLICGLYLPNGVLGLTEVNEQSLFKRPKIDNIGPKIWNCPENITVKADEGRLTTTVFWKKPYANDTKDGNVKVHKKGNKNPGDTFQGHTRIDYYAHDSDGNMGTCSFTIDVTATRCPSPVLGHGVIRVCTDYDGRYGSKCEFECYDGYYLVGKPKTVCQNSGTWDSDPPICKGDFSILQNKSISYNLLFNLIIPEILP